MNRIIPLLLSCSLMLLADIVNGKNSGFLSTPEIFNSYCRQPILDGIYANNDELENYCNSGQSKNTKEWTVYSDRKNNPIYYEANGRNTKKEKLEFMEPLAVKEVKGNWLHVYRRIGDNNEKYQDVGWVRASNLVLSSFSMLSDKGILQKSMTLISFTDIDQTKNLPDEVDKYRVYQEPSTSGVYVKSQTFRVYFILKEQNGYKLLSETDKVTNDNKQMIQARVKGWIVNLQLTSWNHRVCLEPSTNLKDYENSKIPVFLTERGLRYFEKEGGVTKGAIMNHTVSSSIPNPNIMRMPILEALDNGKRFHVATVGTLGGDLNLEKTAISQGMANKARNRLESVNILFVLDATKSMEPYYPAVARSIEGIIESNRLIDAGLKLNFGALIYRDYADGQKSDELMACQGDHKAVVKFINEADRGSLDKDLPEAQYNAILKNIDHVNFDPGQTNIMVLIGDAGNHRNDKFSREDVVRKLVEYEVNVIAFQVINGQHQSFSDFNYDAKRYLHETGQRNSDNVGRVYEDNYQIKAKLENVITDNVLNTSELVFFDDRDSVRQLYTFGRFTYASTSDPMSTDILERNIELACKKHFDWATNILVQSEGLSNASDNIRGGEYERNIVVDALCDKLRLSKTDCQNLVNQLDQFSFEGYTSLHFHNKSSPAYIPVAWVSQVEFRNLKRVLTGVADPSLSTSKRRKAFQEALIQQTMVMTGDVNEDVVSKMTLDEVYEILLGIEFNSGGRYGQLANVSLKELLTLKRKELELFEDFITSFQNSARNFQESRFRDRQFELSGQTFYWIPLNKFPGNEGI